MSDFACQHPVAILNRNGRLHCNGCLEKIGHHASVKEVRIFMPQERQHGPTAELDKERGGMAT